jgi:hypothetical protein
MDAKITCWECGEEFETMTDALAHVRAEHPEVP